LSASAPALSRIQSPFPRRGRSGRRIIVQPALRASGRAAFTWE